MAVEATEERNFHNPIGLFQQVLGPFNSLLEQVLIGSLADRRLHVGANRDSPSSIDGISMVFICKFLTSAGRIVDHAQ